MVKEKENKPKEQRPFFNLFVTRKDVEKMIRDFGNSIERLFHKEEMKSDEILRKVDRIEQRLSVLESGDRKPRATNEDTADEMSRLKSYEEYLLKELLDKYYPYAFEDETKSIYGFMLNLAKSRISSSGERYDLITDPEGYPDFFIEKDPQPNLEKDIIIPALVKKDKGGNIIETIVSGYITKTE